MLKNYLKIAFRNLLKHKGYSAINILGLAIGIACCLIILVYVRHELSYDQFHENADRIARIQTQFEDEMYAVTPSMAGPTARQLSPEIEKWVRFYEPTQFSPAIISVGENRFQEDRFAYADSSFFDIFSFEFIAGDSSTALRTPRSLVLPRKTAEKLFGRINVIGETVNAKIINSEVTFQITGVIEDIPSNSHLQFDYLGSLHTMQGWSQLTDSRIAAANFTTYVLFKNEESFPKATEAINRYIAENYPDHRISGFEFFPLKDIYLKSNTRLRMETVSGSAQNIIGLTFLAFMILLIAMINYVNLATARSSRRASEVGIRKALGAVKSQLVKQFYGESTIITFISVLMAIIIVELIKKPFFSLMNLDISFSLFSDPSAWLLLSGITIVTAALAGSYPAFLLSSYQPVKVLKGLFGSKGSDGTLRKTLVVSQFAISTFLILATVIIYQQTDFILNKDLGFNDEQILVLPASDSELSARQDLLKSEMLRQPGVESATYMSNIPGSVFGGYGSVHAADMDPIPTDAGSADADLIEATGIELLAGNGFPQNPGYSKNQGYVYLINETLAAAHGWSPDEAIGKFFNVLGGREGEVVGVMRDFNYQSLREQVNPLALFMDKEMHNYLLLKVAPDNFGNTLASLENVWQNIAPHRPFEFEFMDQQMQALYQTEVQTRNLTFVFAMLAIFIACLGLMGLSSFIIERRAKEIGIRKVLGASVPGIVANLSSDFLKLVGIGFLIGVPIAWYAMNRWLADFAYRIEIGPGIFALAGIAALAIALATVSWQSVKAALANPVESLRSE